MVSLNELGVSKQIDYEENHCYCYRYFSSMWYMYVRNTEEIDF